MIKKTKKNNFVLSMFVIHELPNKAEDNCVLLKPYDFNFSLKSSIQNVPYPFQNVPYPFQILP